MPYSGTVPSKDEESLHLPQATLWEVGKQAEINACKANTVWSESLHFPPGKAAVNLDCIDAIEHGRDVLFPNRYKARLVFRNHKFVVKSP